MYNALFARFGIDAVYLAFDVHPDQAERVADLIRVFGLVGVNLTVPFKERIVPHLDELTQAARESGAVNVVIQVDGTLAGYNTDGEGLVSSLREEGGPEVEGSRVVILGAGGAGRAVASGLLDHGAAQVTILNRTESRAQAAADSLADSFASSTLVTGALTPGVFREMASGADLVVNTTAGPARELIDELDPGVLASGASWVDANYWMEDPPCADACSASGVRFHDGLGMLAHQGALAFELFTGYPVTGAEIRAFLTEAK